MGSGDLASAEKRKFPRLKVEVDVEFRTIEDLDETKTTTINRNFETRKTKDISPMGVCIESGRYIEPGSILELKFKFPGQTSHGIGRVIWSRDLSGDGDFCCGLEFLAVAHGKIDQFANNIAQYYFEQFTIDKSKHFVFLKEIISKFIPKD